MLTDQCRRSKRSARQQCAGGRDTGKAIRSLSRKACAAAIGSDVISAATGVGQPHQFPDSLLSNPRQPADLPDRLPAIPHRFQRATSCRAFPQLPRSRLTFQRRRFSGTTTPRRRPGVPGRRSTSQGRQRCAAPAPPPPAGSQPLRRGQPSGRLSFSSFEIPCGHAKPAIAYAAPPQTHQSPSPPTPDHHHRRPPSHRLRRTPTLPDRSTPAPPPRSARQI